MRIAALFVAAVTAVFAPRTEATQGNTVSLGSVVDRGPGLLAGRYYLRAAEMTLARKQHLRLELPPFPVGREFVLGIEFNEEGCAGSNSRNEISFRLVDDQGRLVFSTVGALRDLTWATNLGSCESAFGYVRGSAEEVPLGRDGDVCMRPKFAGIDYGNGTYFAPREGVRYSLEVEMTAESINKQGGAVFGVVFKDVGVFDAKNRNACLRK